MPHDGRAGPYADAMELVPNGVDHVIYAAGVQDNGERHSIWDSAEGVRHVLEWCGDRRVSDFVLLSSMDVCRLSTAQSEELQVEACVSPAEVLLKHKRVSTLTAPARKALESELVMEDLCAKEDDVDEAMWEVKCGVLRLSEPYGDGIEDGPLAELLADEGSSSAADFGIVCRAFCVICDRTFSSTPAFHAALSATDPLFRPLWDVSLDQWMAEGAHDSVLKAGLLTGCRGTGALWRFTVMEACFDEALMSHQDYIKAQQKESVWNGYGSFHNKYSNEKVHTVLVELVQT